MKKVIAILIFGFVGTLIGIGYIPTIFIEDFKKQFATTIQENNKY